MIKNDTPETVIVEEKISTVSGETAVRKYSKGKMLGKGGFATCYEFVNLETKKVTASKIIPKNTLTKSRAKQKVLATPQTPLISLQSALSCFQKSKFIAVFIINILLPLIMCLRTMTTFIFF